jgi:anti-sigma B factor antagonist
MSEVSSVPFKVESEVRGGEAVLRLAGEFDLAGTQRVEEAAEGLIAAGPERLLLDLSGLRFIDSSGLRVIVVLHQRASQEGWALELVRPGPPVMRVFQISGLADRLRFVD